MDKNEQLALLLSDKNKWNDWRNKNPSVIPNLSGRTISSVDLSGIDLRNTNLSGTSFINVVLSFARFDGANLSKAKFEAINIKVENFKAVHSKVAKGGLSFDGADLTESEFFEAKLDKSSFINAKLDSARFGKDSKANVKLSACDFTGASFHKAKLKNVNLNNSNLTNAILTETQLSRVSMLNTDLGNSILKNVSFYSVKFPRNEHFSRLNFSTCHLDNINLSGAVLSGVDFSCATLNEVDFSSSQIDSCNFHKSKFSNCNFDKSIAENSNFSDTIFATHRGDNSLRQASLKKCDFSNADLSKSILIGSDLRCCNFQNTNLRDTELSGIRYGRWMSKYSGIMLERSLGNIRFVEFSNNQSYLDDLRVTNPFIYYFWLITCDCGRSFMLWMFWSALAAILFGLKFYSLGSESFELSHLPWQKDSMIYYSVVTFTTLGFGDILPKTTEAARWVMAEVITGYIMLGGLITIFASKIARRT